MTIIPEPWLQIAVEKSLMKFVERKVQKEHGKDKFITTKFYDESYGLEVRWSFYNLPGDSFAERQAGAEYFTPQEAFKIFMES